jgi:hypothetical protein
MMERKRGANLFLFLTRARVSLSRVASPGEMATLAPLLPTTSFPGVLGWKANIPMADLVKAASTIHTPWVQDSNPLHSLTGLAHLTTLGTALHTLDAFQSKLTNLLRTELVDWRNPLDLSKTDLLNPLSRSALYVERGLNLDLVHFPRAAFIESMAVGGLTDDAPEQPLSHEELALQRNNKAHDRLQRFEISVRSFIAKHMQAVFGGHWLKRQVPGDVYSDWKDKSQRDRDRGGPVRPLIDYADFTHYEKIITQKDNWDKVFRPHFHRRESVTESFQRLYPIRICTMHAQPITTDDELYLLAEITRLLKVIV